MFSVYVKKTTYIPKWWILYVFCFLRRKAALTPLTLVQLWLHFLIFMRRFTVTDGNINLFDSIITLTAMYHYRLNGLKPPGHIKLFTSHVHEKRTVWEHKLGLLSCTLALWPSRSPLLMLVYLSKWWPVDGSQKSASLCFQFEEFHPTKTFLPALPFFLLLRWRKEGHRSGRASCVFY